MMWSKVKTFPRGAEARSGELLITAIGQALTQITPQNVAQLKLAWRFQIGDNGGATLPELEAESI